MLIHIHTYITSYNILGSYVCMFVSSRKQQTGEDSDNNGRRKIVGGWEGTLKEALQKK